MGDLTPQRITEIRARLDAATDGPWSQFVDTWRPIAPVSVHRIGAVDEDIANVYLTRPADAALIAAAPVDLADLLDEVKRLTAENTRLRAVAEAADRLVDRWRRGDYPERFTKTAGVGYRAARWDASDELEGAARAWREGE